MKNFIVLLLSVYHLAFGANVGVLVHNCGNEVKSVEMWGEKNSCCAAEEAHDCCRFETKVFQLDQYFLSSLEWQANATCLAWDFSNSDYFSGFSTKIFSCRQPFFQLAVRKVFEPPKIPIWLKFNVLRI